MAVDDRLDRIARYFLTCRSAAEVDPASLGSGLLPLVYALDIERSAPAEPPKLRIRLTGTAVDEMFGRRIAGHHLDEFLHGPRSARVLYAFHCCARAQDSFWMRQVVRIADQAPRFVEGVAIHVAPNRIYGGLLHGEYPAGEQGEDHAPSALELRLLTP